MPQTSSLTHVEALDKAGLLTQFKDDKRVDELPGLMEDHLDTLLNILSLIFSGSPLPEVLTIIARLVESQGKGTLCTIWLADEDGKKLHCAAAPSLPGSVLRQGPYLLVRKGHRAALQFIGENQCM